MPRSRKGPASAAEKRAKTVDKASLNVFAPRSGIVEPYTNIKIDNFFEIRDMQMQMYQAKVVFILSHCHEDHLKGLNGG